MLSLAKLRFKLNLKKFLDYYILLIIITIRKKIISMFFFLFYNKLNNYDRSFNIFIYYFLFDWINIKFRNIDRLKGNKFDLFINLVLIVPINH